MIAVLQRVSQGSVSVDNILISSITHGLVIFLGVMDNDEKNDCELLSKKIANFRIFNDNQHKMNLSISDIKGDILIVSQFTLVANIKKGRRPSFTESANPQAAENFYNIFLDQLKDSNLKIQSGKFGSMMDIHLINNGPATFILDSKI